MVRKDAGHIVSAKAQQLKGAQALLEYCQTTSSLRPEWEAEYNQTDGNQHAAP